MKEIPLTTIERQQGGFTHKFVLNEADLTITTAATGQAITLKTLPIGTYVGACAIKLPTPFAQAGDAANNTTTMSLGDGGSATRYAASIELNGNGVSIAYKEGTNTRLAYTSAGALIATFGATASGKNLAALDSGEVHILATIVDLTQL